jgi:hypothetical protein
MEVVMRKLVVLFIGLSTAMGFAATRFTNCEKSGGSELGLSVAPDLIEYEESFGWSLTTGTRRETGDNKRRRPKIDRDLRVKYNAAAVNIPGFWSEKENEVSISLRNKHRSTASTEYDESFVLSFKGCDSEGESTATYSFKVVDAAKDGKGPLHKVGASGNATYECTCGED